MAYDTDIVRAERVIREALKEVAEVSGDPAPDVLIKALGGYALELEVRIWTPTRQREVLQVNSIATRVIKDALVSNGIKLPFPTQVSILRDATEKRPEDGA